MSFRPLTRWCVPLQVAGIVLGLSVLALAPPTFGRMLLLPTDAAAAAQLVPRALSAGGLLVGRGPLPRSYVVVGDRARLRAALGAGIITLAAPPAGCGSTAA
jgi:hypothetical protein